MHMGGPASPLVSRVASRAASGPASSVPWESAQAIAKKGMSRISRRMDMKSHKADSVPARALGKPGHVSASLCHRAQVSQQMPEIVKRRRQQVPLYSSRHNKRNDALQPKLDVQLALVSQVRKQAGVLPVVADQLPQVLDRVPAVPSPEAPVMKV